MTEPGPADAPRSLPALSLIRRILAEAAPGAIGLAHGAPTHAVPGAVLEALSAAVAERRLAYTPTAGLPELCRAIALRRPHHGDSGASVIVTGGSQEALALAVLGLLGEGDEVLVPDLAYPSYEALARFAGATVVRAPAQELAEALGARTRAVVVASPANPTGAVEPPERLARLVDRAAERGAFVISDEVYDELWLSGPRPAYPAGERVIHLGGVSKSLGAPGLRLGWLIAAPGTVARLLPLHQHVLTCAPSLSQAAALAGLTMPAAELEAVRAYYRSRWATARAALEALPTGVQWREPAGAFYVLLDVRKLVGADTAAFALDLARRGIVQVVPGEAFGPAGAGTLRVSFCAPDAELREGIDRLGRALGA